VFFKFGPSPRNSFDQAMPVVGDNTDNGTKKSQGVQNSTRRARSARSCTTELPNPERSVATAAQ